VTDEIATPHFVRPRYDICASLSNFLVSSAVSVVHFLLVFSIAIDKIFSIILPPAGVKILSG